MIEGCIKSQEETSFLFFSLSLENWTSVWNQKRVSWFAIQSDHGRK